MDTLDSPSPLGKHRSDASTPTYLIDEALRDVSDAAKIDAYREAFLHIDWRPAPFFLDSDETHVLEHWEEELEHTGQLIQRHEPEVAAAAGLHVADVRDAINRLSNQEISNHLQKNKAEFRKFQHVTHAGTEDLLENAFDGQATPDDLLTLLQSHPAEIDSLELAKQTLGGAGIKDRAVMLGALSDLLRLTVDGFTASINDPTYALQWLNYVDMSKPPTVFGIVRKQVVASAPCYTEGADKLEVVVRDVIALHTPFTKENAGLFGLIVPQIDGPTPLKMSLSKGEKIPFDDLQAIDHTQEVVNGIHRSPAEWYKIVKRVETGLATIGTVGAEGVFPIITSVYARTAA